MKPSTRSPTRVGIRGEVTKFANAESRIAASQIHDGGSDSRIMHIPGKIIDTQFDNTVFPLFAGTMRPDLSRPIAAYAAEKKNGVYGGKFILYDKTAEALKEYQSALKREGGNPRKALEYIRVASLVDSATINATKNLNILDRVLGLQTRNYFLQEVVTKVPAPNLVFSVDTYTEGTVQGQLPELVEPYLVGHTESRATNVLWKNVGHIAISIEAELKSIHNVQALRQDKTIRDMLRVLNNQISTILESGTTAGGSDWGLVNGTYFRSANKPQDDIQGVVTTIRGNGFNVDFLAMHDRPASDLASNDFTKGPGSQSGGFILDNQDHYSIPGLPPIVIDQALTNTKATVGSIDAVWLGQGPTIVASYNNDVVGYKGWLVTQWVLPYLANTGGLRTLTSISA